ncbi:hypothetical protein [Halorhabdus rudnickae]|uniref:hypothetical protein n=1 Tax=Halorhabdus rudnickae TaxID=1775544 RepID=UPI0010832CA3|nr:hypothetical protein [Halorhabdus rudnickae]
MTEYTLTGENPTDLPKRAVRALTEKMTVLPNTGWVKDADGRYLVISESGSEYLVDIRESRCDCPDAHHNLDAEEQCKHERRVNYATGETSIPEWADPSAIDDQLGTHTDSDPVRAATDGGITGESTDDSPPLNAPEHSDCDCDDLHGDFPCADCYIEGRKEMPE